MFREKYYEWKNWREMIHTTWNPKDPGAVRIHLIPPKFTPFRFIPSVAILNGNQILPVNESWAILLTEFIRQLNTFGDGEMPEEAEAELDNIQITFYSSDREIHNCLTGSGHYEKTVEGIKNALQAGLSVNVNIPLCRENKNYRETVAFLKSLGVTYVTCSGLIPAGNASKSTQVSMRLSEEEITEIVRQAAEYCAENGMELSFTSPGWIREEAFQEMGLEIPSCGAALSNMAVTPSGDVVACQSCMDRETFGNLLDTDWKKIWNHPACKKYREYSRKMMQKCPLGKERTDG